MIEIIEICFLQLSCIFRVKKTGNSTRRVKIKLYIKAHGTLRVSYGLKTLISHPGILFETE